MDHCIGRDYEWMPDRSVTSSMGSIRGGARHVRYFHAVGIGDGGSPVTVAVCGEQPDDIDARGDWQDHTLHLYGERCPGCVDKVPIAGQPWLSRS